MEAYAIIETGGKQYKVQKGDTVDIELVDGEEGSVLEFDTLAVSDGNTLKLGSPVVEGAKVSASIVKSFRGKKIYSFKKKRRKGYRRKIGHRQDLLKIKVDKITS